MNKILIFGAIVEATVEEAVTEVLENAASAVEEAAEEVAAELEQAVEAVSEEAVAETVEKIGETLNSLDQSTND
jgi:hypothetical protein